MPVIIAAAGLAVSVAATAASVAAAANQAKQQQAAANYNAQVQANDAQVATWQRQQQEQEYAQQALVTQEQGAANASRLELQNNTVIARNVAAAASDGLAITGSTQDVISGSAANNELAVDDEEHKTAIAAWQDQIGAANASFNSQIQANRYSAESGLDTMQAGFAQESGMFGAIGAGLSGASNTLTALQTLNNQEKATTGTDLFGD